MFPQFVVLTGLMAAGAMAAPASCPVNGTVAVDATTIVSTMTVTTPPAAATAITLAPEAVGSLAKNATANTVVIKSTVAAQTSLQELTHIVDRVADKVFRVTAFVKQTVDRHGHHMSKEHASTVADVISLPMAVLHTLLDHVTVHIRHMCHGPHGHHLLPGLPIGLDANGVAAAGIHPEVLAVLEKTRGMLSEISATTQHLVKALGMVHIAEVVHPVMVAVRELMLALEEHLTGAGEAHETAAGCSCDACTECDEEEDDEDDEDDDGECCSHHGHGFRAGLKQKLRGKAMRYLHRHYRSICRFLLGDLENIIDDVEEYYDAVYDGPYNSHTIPIATAAGSSCDPQARNLLMDHIGKVGEIMELVQLAWSSPAAIEEVFADKSAEVEVEADSE